MIRLFHFWLHQVSRGTPYAAQIGVGRGTAQDENPLCFLRYRPGSKNQPFCSGSSLCDLRRSVNLLERFSF